MTQGDTTMADTMVNFPSNGATTAGYLATPAGGKGPGVLVIQEWWGLVGHIKSVCDRFAKEGFTALAPDMYHGQTANEPDGAGKLFMALNIGQAEKDLRGAAQYLLRHSSSAKLGVVGFCMGGQLALFAATLNPAIGACVNFYGVHPNVKPDYAKLNGPVLGLFAGKDQFVTPQVARDVDAAIKKAGKQSEIHIYPNADHAFFNDERPDVYDKAAAQDAWRRTLDFFRQHVKS
jgi:carboxymethylenebutenolidase